jgi:hypothetical protein
MYDRKRIETQVAINPTDDIHQLLDGLSFAKRFGNEPWL